MMKRNIWIFVLLFVGGIIKSNAQQILIDLSSIDGIDITPENILNIRIHSTFNKTVDVVVKGSIRYRNSDLSILYNFRTKLFPGVNSIDKNTVFPQYQYSSTALRELFQIHKVLPFGTYKYCVQVNLSSGENTLTENEECVYRQAEDQFMITLIEPENEAKIYEYNPLFTWVATYSFSTELSYKIRIAEIKEEQNTYNAITRNNPIYQEGNLMHNSMSYPLYAKPLKLNQPYAWTVDAYYKGILLGGAEPWKFTIIEDTLLKSLPVESSYIDVNIENGSNLYFAVGDIKLLYVENDYLENEIIIKIFRKGKVVKTLAWKVQSGQNFKIYDARELGFRHKEDFVVELEFLRTRSEQKTKTIRYKYVNQDFIH